MVRRGLSISSPMNEPASQPPKAKKIVDQKMAFFKLGRGMSSWKAKLVADPKWAQETTARTISSEMGMMLPRVQTLLSHLPAFTHTTFMSVMKAGQARAKMRK